ncbi:Beta-galactosidase C-terminal domain [Naasia aerilata]|uniref:Beta-galactosidase C-terminal domain n=1 Tax=Naasia aerilata TaxID=1162966 RepID=UPI003D9B204E
MPGRSRRRRPCHHPPEDGRRDRDVRQHAARRGLLRVVPGSLCSGARADACRPRRHGSGGSPPTRKEANYLFLMNQTDRPLRAEARGTDLVTGTSYDDGIEVAGGQVVVLREDSA